MSLTIAERITRLETKMEQVETTLSGMDEKLDKIHEAFFQAKGAKWVLVGGATLVGALITFIPSLASFLSGLPK